MKLTVRLFAGLKELFGRDNIIVDISENATVMDLRQLLLNVQPEFQMHILQSLVAVNRSYVDMEYVLHPEDEIALIPPVGGGSPSLPVETSLISLEPLNVAMAFQMMESVYHGGTVMFCGTAREWTGGRKTKSLTYDAYPEMALAQMRRIEEDVQAAFPGVATLLWHRVGTLVPMDIAVICAAASAHRDTAFRACRILIERLKREVPIWKKEFYEDGETVWQANEIPTKAIPSQEA